MLIDCDSCAVRGPACGDCVVSVLLGQPAMPQRATDPAALTAPGRQDGGPWQIGAEDRRALAVLAAAGMVPRLRLVPRHDDDDRRAG